MAIYFKVTCKLELNNVEEENMQCEKLFTRLLKPSSALDSIYSIFQYRLRRIKYKWIASEGESSSQWDSKDSIVATDQRYFISGTQNNAFQNGDRIREAFQFKKKKGDERHF